MALNFVELSGVFEDGQGNPLSGTVTFTPNTTVYAAGIPVLEVDVPIDAQIVAGQLKNSSGGTLQLLATDNSGLTFAGQTGFLFYSCSMVLAGQVLDTWSFFLPYDTLGAGPVDLMSLANTGAGGSGSGLPLPSGTPGVGQVPAVTTVSPLALDWANSGGGGGAVSSVFGRTGAVAATAGDYSVGQVTGAAPLASPALSGTPTAPTATALTGNTQMATTAYADSAVSVEKSRAQTAEGLAALKANNLSDLVSAATARTNLGLGSAATLGSTAVAQTANNLSDLGSEATARTNLGLGTAAVLNAGAVAQTANNLSDLASSVTARTNLGLGSAATQPASAFDASGAASSALASAIAACLPTMTQAGVSASGTLATNVISEVTATSGVVAMTLPASVTNALIVVERAAASTSNVTVTGNIRGVAATTITLQLASESEIFLGYGASWWPIGGHKTLSSLQALFLSVAGGSLTGSLTVAGALCVVPYTLIDASSIAVNAALSNSFRITLGGNRTLASPSNPTDGQLMRVLVIQDGTGSRTLAYGSAYAFPASIGTPVLSSTPGYQDALVFEYEAASTTWWCRGFTPESVTAVPYTVSQGGTGLATLTAYELIAGGTTTTGAVQQIAAGAAGTVLTGAGGSALPAFGNITSAMLPSATTSAKGAVILDGTAADILPAGVQAAGANGEAADSGHVHPDMYGGMGELGTLLGHTFPYPFSVATFQPTAGVLACSRLLVPVGGTSNNVYAWISAAGATPANVYVLLINLSGTIVAQSAQRSGDSALTTSAALWTVPWSSAAVLAAGYYYAAILVGSAGTMPAFRSLATSSAGVVNLGLTAAATNLRAANYGTSLTSPPASPITMTSMAASAGPVWMAVGP